MPDGRHPIRISSHQLPCSGISLSLDFHIILLVPASATTLLLYPTRTHSTASASSSHRSIGKLPLKVNPLSCCVAAAPGLHRWSTSINCTICAFSSSQSWMVPGLRSGPNLVGFLSFPESPAKPTKTRPIPLDFNFP